MPDLRELAKQVGPNTNANAFPYLPIQRADPLVRPWVPCYVSTWTRIGYFIP